MHAELSGQRRADFVVVGGQRCGSTQLGSLLDSVPGISCPHLELPYFEDPYFGASALSEFHRYVFAGHAERYGFKRPEYLHRSEVPRRLHEYRPDLKVLAVLRDPVDRFLSAVIWYMYVGYIPAARLGPAVRSLLDDWRTGTLSPRARELFEYSHFAAGIEQYLNLFGDEQVLVVAADELFDRSTQRRVVNDALGLIGHAPIDRALEIDGDRNASTGNYYRLRLLRLRLPFALSWDKLGVVEYQPRWHWQRPWRLAPLALVRGLDRMLAMVARSGPGDIGEPMRTELASMFEPDVERLTHVLGRRLSWARRYDTSRLEPPPSDFATAPPAGAHRDEA